ncbi:MULTISPECIES: hypothetical protein [Streptomyces]|nr:MULTISPECIES: hypothetical protein [Streptomyces]
MLGSQGLTVISVAHTKDVVMSPADLPTAIAPLSGILTPTP